jgi:type VI secretion system protein ImpE
MNALESLRAGNLAETYTDLTAQVRKNPADAKLRIFLFQLLCIRGEWERAVTQLKVIGEIDPGALAMVQTYREAIVCELVREKVFAGEKAPMVFGEPAKWVALMIEALKPLATGDAAKAADVRAEAFELAPATSGTADGQAFEWIADADMRLGPIFEIIMNGRYYWAPIDTVSRLKFEKPTDLRDRVWTPVEITWANGGEVVGFIPTRYPGAAQSGSDSIMLALETAWTDVAADTFVGTGQRLFATDTADLPLMDIREIKLDTASDDALAPDDVESGADEAG